MQENSPLVVFAYRRLGHLRQTLEALEQAAAVRGGATVYIFSDGAKADAVCVRDVEAVRTYLRGLVNRPTSFTHVHLIERERNFGLASSVISGVTQVLEKHERAIIIEDDIVVRNDFLIFMDEALEKYRDDKEVFSVTGYALPIRIPASYPYDVLFFPRASSWGWATWRNRWQKVDWKRNSYRRYVGRGAERRAFSDGGYDLPLMFEAQVRGELDSWAIRWAYAHFQNRAYCVYPLTPRLVNIGMDGSGTHGDNTGVMTIVKALPEATAAQMVKLSDGVVLDAEILASARALYEWPWRAKVKFSLRRAILGSLHALGLPRRK